ncbi:MAG: DNA polymerase III subunit delta [Synergistetes bacterium]|nr:DNA polymerase III subunit delta [Synergistota bacterium]
MIKLKPVFLLVCKDDALLHKWIEKNAQGVEETSFLDGGELSWSKLYEEGRSVSLFSARRLVVVKKAEDIQKEGEDLFLSYLSYPSPNVFFLLTAESIPSSGKVFKALVQKKLYAELKKPTGKGLYKWIEEEVESFGKKIEEEAVFVLAERFSENLEVLESEIKKLILYVGEKREIKKEDVMEVASTFIEGSPFELLDSLLSKDGLKFLKSLERSFIMKEPPVKILSTIGKYLRIMFFLKADPSLEEVILKDMHPFFANKIKKGAILYAPMSLSISYKRLALADDLIKKGRGNPYDLLVWAVSPLFIERKEPEKQEVP